MKLLLTDVQTRLISKVPELKYTDEDSGQLDYFGSHPTVKFPCALIDINTVSWSNIGHTVQLGLVQIKIRIAFLPLSKSSTGAPQSQKDKAFGTLDVVKLVHKALHGWTGHRHYTALIRTATTKSKRADGMKIYDVTYTCELTDNTTEIIREKMVAVINQTE